jgi:hypothetical protein
MDERRPRFGKKEVKIVPLPDGVHFVEYRKMLSNSKKTLGERYTFINETDECDIEIQSFRENKSEDFRHQSTNAILNGWTVNEESRNKLYELCIIMSRNPIAWFKQLKLEKEGTVAHNQYKRIKCEQSAIRLRELDEQIKRSNEFDAMDSQCSKVLREFPHIDNAVHFYLSRRDDGWIISPYICEDAGLIIGVNKRDKVIDYIHLDSEEGAVPHEEWKDISSIEDFRKFLCKFPDWIDCYPIDYFQDNFYEYEGLSDIYYNGRDDRLLRDVASTVLIEQYGNEFESKIHFRRSNLNDD